MKCLRRKSNEKNSNALQNVSSNIRQRKDVVQISRNNKNMFYREFWHYSELVVHSFAPYNALLAFYEITDEMDGLPATMVFVGNFKNCGTSISTSNLRHIDRKILKTGNFKNLSVSQKLN